MRTGERVAWPVTGEGAAHYPPLPALEVCLHVISVYSMIFLLAQSRFTVIYQTKTARRCFWLDDRPDSAAQGWHFQGCYLTVDIVTVTVMTVNGQVTPA